MREPAAILLALSMTHTPNLVRLARTAALPRGMTFLLEVAAGDVEALKDVSRSTRRSEQSVREAAGFFIEQILLTRDADSYRVLGAGIGTPGNELRRHMALLLKWLHPDVAARNNANGGVDRSVFANRITRAWEDLKTEERRTTYDLSLRQATKTSRSQQRARPANITSKGNPKTSLQKPARTTQPKQRSRNRKRQAAFRVERDTILTRLAMFLRGHR